MPTVKTNKKKAAKPVAKPVAVKAATKPKAVKVAPVNATGFTLEDNVEIPARARLGGVSHYPFASMNVGQSFFIPSDIEPSIYESEAEAAKAELEANRTIANRLSGATRRFTKKNKDYKFAIRTGSTPSGVRVWRVEA